MTRSLGNETSYTCSNKGLLLPFVSEYTWSIEFRAVVYLIGMLECFLGVAIVADIFMCAIEKITSKTKTITQDRNGLAENIKVKVWNDTVANLTLMALGSSAPEIILTTYETIGNNFVSGELGPASVVGAAGFNLLIITAACISSIPNDQVRTIKSIKVYLVTTFFGIFAYVWLILILVVISPNVVEVWEACMTLVFFPIMVFLAYLADKNFFLNRGPDMYRFDASAEQTIDRSSMIDVIKRISLEPGLTETDAACLAARKLFNENPHSRMWYRVGAIRRITGGRRAKPKLTEPLKKIYKELTIEEQSSKQEELKTDGRTDVAVIEFVRATTSVWENAGTVSVDVRRHGILDKQVVCRVESSDGTAKAGEDYIALNETVTFRPHEEIRAVTLNIIDDNQWEPDEVFYLKLTLVEPSSSKEAIIGKVSLMQITILDDDDPGTVHFPKDDVSVPYSQEMARIPVSRTRGADGLVTVRWQTLDQTAVAGRNYQKCGGEVIFQHGETAVDIQVPIIGKSGSGYEELHFQIELVDTTGGAVLGEPRTINVHITDDEDFARVLRRVETLTQTTMESADIMAHSWTSQLKNALSVNGGDIENATRSDFFMHFLTFGWKVLFSFIPPTDYLGGWLTFVVALCAIGVLTAVIGDMASLFGCLVGLKDSVTAITFVALGTSLPDLFASRAAARHEAHADSAVGNINGSNSVNVFLGLGISWVLASIYWTSKGTQFVVPKGTLGFSVSVYSSCALICICLLMARRFMPLFGKAELGGHKIPARLSSLFCVALWIIYILVSSLQAYGYIHVEE